MASIRKIRKAFKYRYGIKIISVRLKFKSAAIRFTPTMRKQLRQSFTETMRNNFY